MSAPPLVASPRRHPADAPGGTRQRRRLIGLAVLLALLAVAVVASVSVGSRLIPPEQVWRSLVAPDGGEADAIVRSLRVPRTVLGALVGLSLGVAGVLMQSHTRNPIADPGLLGISSGAACAVVAGVFLFGVSSFGGQVPLALAGALVASTAVFALASGGRGPSPVTLVLAGAAMTALLSGVTSAIVLLDERSLEVYRFWRIGGLAGRPSDLLWQMLPVLAAGLLLALANAPGLNALALGDDVAAALGQRVRLTRAVGVLAIALLTGTSVAAAGPIGFVGLMAPHLARALTGPDHRWMVPYAGLTGAILVLLADVLGRVARGSGEVEVGIVLAVLGGPFFIAVIRRRKLVAL
ncbi:FecCD family ABC transporter permease [Marinitenerispora sediminis]|uniref:Iron ABC transporter permease n=1 Tax=Marinitenerispora sediminis TaxID=1931232 RepID=A0A368T2E3_9ACTN|nr:iron ABC transporter permease [Marinitenerispora sediminis]RCV55006.1 iron ABC transporter permease [Marinitenerispora sediminis]RCV56279.1 iron ABC transporter permease [Marinitenerispora sediminis]RCV61211.1 iron ABC transporter permease [Marinitenerispora sediminis]